MPLPFSHQSARLDKSHSLIESEMMGKLPSNGVFVRKYAIISNAVPFYLSKYYERFGST